MLRWLLTLFACGRGPPPPLVDLHWPEVDPAVRAVRISMAIRGLRPTEAELGELAVDPGALDAMVDTWLDDPAFGLMVRDLHAERFELRADQQPPWPALGPLAGTPTGAISGAMNEQALRLVERIVTEGRPYTEILTTDDNESDAVLAAAYGLTFDPEGPEWQVSSWADGRPASGVLATTGLWMRHFSNSSGKHRARAEFIARALLCDAIGAVDMAFVAGIDAPSDLSMADVLATDPNCLGCHQTLDPLSAAFWPFPLNLSGNRIEEAYAADCIGEVESVNCYPPAVWNAPPAHTQQEYGLPDPAYYGQPVDDLGDVAVLVSEDPRFATCTARFTRAFLAQEEVSEVDLAEVDRLAAVLVDSGWDFRELVRAVVMAPSFTGAPLVVRPEAYARLLESWSGCPLVAEPDPVWGPSDLMREGRNGYRVLLGGTDHQDIKRPDHTFDGPRILAIDAMAEMAAGCALARDLAVGPSERRWVADPTASDPEAVRQGLADLYAEALGVRLAPDDPTLDPAQALFDAGLAAHDAPTAWSWVLRATFADPAVVVY